MVLGCASATHHGRDQIRRLSAQARRRGVHLIGADTPANVRQATPGLFDELVELPVFDAEGCRAWAAARPRIDAALTFREMCVEPLAALCRELGIAGNDPRAAHLVRHKDLARERLRAAGLPQPPVLRVRARRDAVAFMARTGPGPWIVKPPDGVGSAGVLLVRDDAELPPATGEPFLIETFVDGSEHSAEGVCVDGVPRVLAITEKFRTDRFVSTGQRMPARLGEGTAREAAEAVERALRVVGITRGIFHVEFFATGQGVVLGEMHARPGGDFLPALTEGTRPGLELYGTLMDDLLGDGVAAFPEPVAAAGVDYLLLRRGRVRSVDGWASVRRDASVIAAHLDVRPGDEVRPVRSYLDRHGVVAVTGPDADAVEGTLARLRRTFRVVIER
jgi:hypothetical protein